MIWARNQIALGVTESVRPTNRLRLSAKPSARNLQLPQLIDFALQPVPQRTFRP